MTRINTNVAALTAQKSLGRSQASLQQALTRLSTGLRINSGKDDPAGLIASEVLRADITSVDRAISNSERANQVIATADSALGQVSALLNDIRGLVTEAANEGAMSDDQVAANQLQVDSSLEAINRIAQTTTFQGRKLLDGSLSFVTSATQNFDDITDLEIHQANLGATGQIDVEVAILAAATKAQITNATGPDTNASATLSFGTGYHMASQAGQTAEIDIYLSGTKTTPQVKVSHGAITGAQAAWNGDVLEITLEDATGDGSTVAEVVTAVNGVAGGGVYAYAVDDTQDFATAGEDYAAKNMEASTLTIDAKVAGADLNNMAIKIATDTAQTSTPGADYDATTNTLTITIDSDLADETLLSAIDSAIEGIDPATSYGGFTVTPDYGTNSYGRTTISGDSNLPDNSVTGNTLYTGGGVLADEVTFTLGGKSGVEVFSFQQYTKVSDIVAAVNLVSDATGVTATDNAGTLELDSVAYGSNAVVAVNVITEGSSGTFESNLSATRDTGTDINATVNGYNADGDGNALSINTATLDMDATITAGSSDTIQFSITEGGALFQLGPEVVSNQQARLGIPSFNTAQLRGESGRLYQIGSGRAAALATDPTTAAKVVDEVINKVTSLRGRLGAFQKTTIEPNIASLTDTMETLTEAESFIRDADFAAETAALTRAQILVQSGVSVTAIANSNPQNVLALLR